MLKALIMQRLITVGSIASGSDVRQVFGVLEVDDRFRVILDLDLLFVLAAAARGFGVAAHSKILLLCRRYSWRTVLVGRCRNACELAPCPF